MIMIFYLGIVMLSFTRIHSVVQVALMLIPGAAYSVYAQDPVYLIVTALALLSASCIYAPLAFVASRLIGRGFALTLHRYRALYFLMAIVAFVPLTFSITQWIGIL